MSNNKQIDIAELAIKEYPFSNDSVRNAFINGYNKAKELHKNQTIELPSDEDIEPVKALEEDSDWYLIPNKLCDEFKNDTYNEEMVESGGFDDKWWKYKTGGDLNLIQLYAKIQGDNK